METCSRRGVFRLMATIHVNKGVVALLHVTFQLESLQNFQERFERRDGMSEGSPFNVFCDSTREVASIKQVLFSGFVRIRPLIPDLRYEGIGEMASKYSTQFLCGNMHR